jgi:hypothetical protein
LFLGPFGIPVWSSVVFAPIRAKLAIWNGLKDFEAGPKMATGKMASKFKQILLVILVAANPADAKLKRTIIHTDDAPAAIGPYNQGMQSVQIKQLLAHYVLFNSKCKL